MFKNLINKLFNTDIPYDHSHYYVLKRFEVENPFKLENHDIITENCHIHTHEIKDNFNYLPLLEIVYRSETQDATIKQYQVLEKLGSKDIVVRRYPKNTDIIHLEPNTDFSIKQQSIFQTVIVTIKVKKPVDLLYQ